ncbi:TetR/AcrR family transcriptional regulator [Tenacibaculum agarivorans]|uniref:TetR/AcrR family transcriptional regulator n=1 Tax=Tenacibaculum agarivorans TaxID=1908389 RepID=UPI00094B8EA3|nr:TetR/AcrR family transcriptional regulator [Tenacibaculum agarivorans]
MTKKDSIISAALKLLTLQGIHATPMSAIAKEAGTGMGTIYNYFPTKEVLINHIYQHIKLKEQEIFASFNESGSIKNQFFTYYNQAFTFFTNTPEYFQFMEQLHASPIITDESKAVGEKAIVNIFQLIENGKKTGIIKAIDTNELLQFIGGSLLSTIRWYLKEKNENYINTQLTLVWDAIKQ